MGWWLHGCRRRRRLAWCGAVFLGWEALAWGPSYREMCATAGATPCDHFTHVASSVWPHVHTHCCHGGGDWVFVLSVWGCMSVRGAQACAAGSGCRWVSSRGWMSRYKLEVESEAPGGGRPVCGCSHCSASVCLRPHRWICGWASCCVLCAVALV